LSSFTRLIGFALLLTVFVVVACDEEGQPPAPDPPPQINVVHAYTRNANPADTVTGLQSNSVYDIIVDNMDRTWVATQSGLSRFIGKTGDGVFNQNNVLPNPKCRALLEHNGKIWIGTWGGGVGIYDIGADSWTKLNSDSGLVNNNVSDFAAVGDSILIATNEGVSIYTDDDQLSMRDRWDLFDRSDGLMTPLVSSVVIATRPTRMEVWCAPRMEEQIPPGDEGEFGITVLREGLSQPIYYTMVNSGLLEALVNDIVYDETTDLFWVAFATKGLASVDVDGSTWTYYSAADGLPSEVIYSIAIIGDVVWVGTQGGVAQKLNGKFQGYGRSGGLPGDRVRAVYSDTPDNLWAGFISAGAALLNPASAQTK
jgi:ligand-binding sensor domain-containing protein